VTEPPLRRRAMFALAFGAAFAGGFPTKAAGDVAKVFRIAMIVPWRSLPGTRAFEEQLRRLRHSARAADPEHRAELEPRADRSGAGRLLRRQRRRPSPRGDALGPDPLLGEGHQDRLFDPTACAVLRKWASAAYKERCGGDGYTHHGGERQTPNGSGACSGGTGSLPAGRRNWTGPMRSQPRGRSATACAKLARRSGGARASSATMSWRRCVADAPNLS